MIDAIRNKVTLPLDEFNSLETVREKRLCQRIAELEALLQRWQKFNTELDEYHSISADGSLLNDTAAALRGKEEE